MIKISANFQQKTESQTQPEAVSEPGLVAKRVILSELGVPEDTLSRINSVADADLLLEYYQRKSVKPSEEMKGKFVDPGKKGVKGDDPYSVSGVLPKPDPQQGIGFEVDPLEKALNPLHPEIAVRRNEESRLGIIFDGTKWRVF